MKLSLIVICALATAGCQSAVAVTKNPDVCLIWQGIYYSASKDTPETVQGVRTNNAKRASYCQ